MKHEQSFHNRKTIQEDIVDFCKQIVNIGKHQYTPPHEIDSDEKDSEFLEMMNSMIEKEISNTDLSIEKISKFLYTSRSRLFYKVKQSTGMTPQQYIMEYRLTKASELLREGNISITEISEMTGFINASHFSTKFKKKFGVPPSRYGK